MASIKTLYMSATGCSTIISINTSGDYHGPCQQALIECVSTSLNVGDECVVDIGYADNHRVQLTGYVKEINPTHPQGTYRVRVFDRLILASDFLVVSDDPNSPLTYNNIQAEDLVRNVLALASITDYSGDHPGFTFGVNNPVKVQLVKSWDFVRQVCHMLAWWCYAGPGGRVYFTSRKPYPVGGDSSSHTFTKGTSGDLLITNHTRSDEKMRNKVVVYGYDGLSATAQASPPAGIALPSGFYKAAVIAYPDIIDNQEMAQQTAEYNLTLLNRVTETITLDSVGIPGLARGDIVDIDFSATVTGTWFVYECSHTINRSGYKTHCVLSK